MTTTMSSLPPSVLILTRLLTEDPTPIDFDINILPDSEEYPNIIKQDGHLAIHASDLPKLAREFRQLYYKERKNRNLLDVTACLLLVCPDHATAWADRKRCLIAHDRQQQELYKELDFVNLLMTRHSKAPNAWIHRKWLVRRIFRSMLLTDVALVKNLVQSEIQVCVGVAERFPKNYYAWTHRMFVVDQAVSSRVDTNNDATPCLSSKETIALLCSELETMEPWLRRHVSDHSAVHYGGHLLRLLLSLSSNAAQLQDALESARRLLELHPTHEALWIWRRLCGNAVLQQQITRKATTDDSSITNKNSPASLQRFLQREIVELLEIANQTQKDLQTRVGEARVELEQTQRHRLSYIMWIMEQATRSNVILQQDMRQEVLELLAKQDYPYNVWRRPRTARLFVQNCSPA